MDFALTESQEVIKKEVGALAGTFSLDYWLEKDDRAEYPSDFVKAFADNGWLGITIPQEYRGGRPPGAPAPPPLPPRCAAGARTPPASPPPPSPRPPAPPAPV